MNMIEETIVSKINHYLGDYLEHVQLSQVSLSILSGHLTITDLTLKADVLENLGVPYIVSAGRCSKISAVIPWHSLYSSPVEISIEDVHILIVPRAEDKPYDVVAEERAILQAKLRMVEMVEAAQKQLKQSSGSDNTDSGYFFHLGMHLARNIQVSIGTIHIRYEDDQTCPNPFSLGLTLNSLNVQTTNAKWDPAYVTDTTSIRKAITVRRLGFYWNCNNNSVHGLQNVQDRLKSLKNSLASKDELSYSPLSADARLQFSPTPQNDNPPFSQPKTRLSVLFEQFDFAISNGQYQSALRFEDWMQRFMIKRKYRKYRPDVTSYKGHYKEWWHFAYNSVVEDIKRKSNNWDWNFLREHKINCDLYIKLWEKYIDSIQLDKEFDKESKAKIAHLESQLDVFSIILIRKKVDIRMTKVKQERDAEEAATGWFSWLVTNSPNPVPVPSGTGVNRKQSFYRRVWTKEEKEELADSIQDNFFPMASYPETYKDVYADIRIKNINLAIKDDTRSTGRTLGELSIIEFNIRFSTRPLNSGMSLFISLRSIKTFGYIHPLIDVNSVQSKLLLSQSKLLLSSKVKDDKGLLEISIEKNPLKSPFQFIVKVNGRPLKIVYDVEVVRNIIQCFTVPPEMQSRQIETKESLRKPPSSLTFKKKPASSAPSKKQISTTKRKETVIPVEISLKLDRIEIELVEIVDPVVSNEKNAIMFRVGTDVHFSRTEKNLCKFSVALSNVKMTKFMFYNDESDFSHVEDHEDIINLEYFKVTGKITADNDMEVSMNVKDEMTLRIGTETINLIKRLAETLSM